MCLSNNCDVSKRVSSTKQHVSVVNKVCRHRKRKINVIVCVFVHVVFVSRLFSIFDNNRNIQLVKVFFPFLFRIFLFLFRYVCTQHELFSPILFQISSVHFMRENLQCAQNVLGWIKCFQRIQ